MKTDNICCSSTHTVSSINMHTHNRHDLVMCTNTAQTDFRTRITSLQTLAHHVRGKKMKEGIFLVSNYDVLMHANID